MPEKIYHQIFIQLLTIFLLSSGLLLLASTDWRILIGVLFLLWGNNLCLNDKFKKKARKLN